MHSASLPSRSKPLARSSAADASALFGEPADLPLDCSAAVGCPSVCRRTSSADVARPCVSWLILPVGGCCAVSPVRAWGFAAMPPVGPDPASVAASVFVRFSISPVHAPARASSKCKPSRPHATATVSVSLMTVAPIRSNNNSAKAIVWRRNVSAGSMFLTLRKRARESKPTDFAHFGLFAQALERGVPQLAVIGPAIVSIAAGRAGSVAKVGTGTRRHRSGRRTGQRSHLSLGGPKRHGIGLLASRAKWANDFGGCRRTTATVADKERPLKLAVSRAFSGVSEAR